MAFSHEKYYYIPIQKVRPFDVLWRRALTWNKKRSKDLFVAGILLVIAVCLKPFHMNKK